jgi:hypothetical protein
VGENQGQNVESPDRGLPRDPASSKGEDTANSGSSLVPPSVDTTAPNTPKPGTSDASPANPTSSYAAKPVPASQIDPMRRLDDADIATIGQIRELSKVGFQVAREFKREIREQPQAGFHAAQELKKGDVPDDAIHGGTKELARNARDQAEHINNYYGPVTIGVMGTVDQSASGVPATQAQSSLDEGTERLWSFDRFVLSQKRVPDLGYILALAALSGAPLSSINRAADDLAQRLVIPKQPSESEKRSDPEVQIATPRRILLAEVGCEIVPGSPQDSDEGYSSAERIRFREPGTEQVLLRDAWLNLRLSIPWIASFLTWLSDHGQATDSELRLAAGRTAGLLTTWDASATEGILFDAWVYSHGLDALGAGLIALTSTSASAARSVEKRLIEWTEGKEGKDKIIVAALLASGAFGRAAPDLAFHLLASLVRQKRHLTLDLAAMGYAVSFAAAADDPQIGGRVIRELSDLRKADDDKIIQKLTGAYFLLLTSVLDEGKKDDDSSEILFLDVLDASPEALQLAARMFNELLAPNVHANVALDRFRSICFCAFRGGARRQQTFLALADAMHATGDEDERDTLRYWLDYWSDDIDELAVAARVTLNSWLENSERGGIAI